MTSMSLDRLSKRFCARVSLDRGSPGRRSVRDRSVMRKRFPVKESRWIPARSRRGCTLHPDAAGVDIGATEIYVSVPIERDADPVRCFGTFTEDLHSLADWLQKCRVTTVAMESTGVYWIPLFQILESRGINVCLVNARHVQNVPGKKDRCLRLPVAAVPSFRWPAACFLSSCAGRLRSPLAVAAP